MRWAYISIKCYFSCQKKPLEFWKWYLLVFTCILTSLKYCALKQGLILECVLKLNKNAIFLIYITVYTLSHIFLKIRYLRLIVQRVSHRIALADFYIPLKSRYPIECDEVVGLVGVYLCGQNIQIGATWRKSQTTTKTLFGCACTFRQAIDCTSWYIV